VAADCHSSTGRQPEDPDASELRGTTPKQAIDVEEGREARQLGHYIGRLSPVQQDNPGDLIGIAGGEISTYGPPGRMTDKDVWSRDMSSIQQGGRSVAAPMPSCGLSAGSLIRDRAVIDAQPWYCVQVGRDPPQ